MREHIFMTDHDATRSGRRPGGILQISEGAVIQSWRINGGDSIVGLIRCDPRDGICLIDECPFRRERGHA